MSSGTQSTTSVNPLALRTCTSCGQQKPATLDNFYRMGTGLRSCCTPCYLAKRRVDPARDSRLGPHLTVPHVNYKVEELRTELEELKKPSEAEATIKKQAMEIAALKVKIDALATALGSTQRLFQMLNSQLLQRNWGVGVQPSMLI